VYDEIALRIMLGRLLEQLVQMEASAHSARALVQNEIYRLDMSRNTPLPVTRDMITAAMRAAGNSGLTRSEIIAAIRRDYGIELPPNTATTTLLRMRRAGLVQRDEFSWFLI
jgi:hypothetical protein